MMKHRNFVLLSLFLSTVIVYLFVTAPPPLVTEGKVGPKIPVARVFEILNEENKIVRNMYTKDIVGNSKTSGLKYSEYWKESDVEAGPLPAQFLRATAVSLEKSKLRLGLFLGSDYPINSSNKFSGDQLERFLLLKQSGKPQFFFVKDVALYSYMFADVAVVKPCVECHNKHKDSPKTDWKLNNVMGATTWTYPEEYVTYDELVELILTLRNAFRNAYSLYIKKVSSFKVQPEIREKWPKDGYFLPSVDVFMEAINQKASSKTFNAIAQLRQNGYVANSDVISGARDTGKI